MKIRILFGWMTIAFLFAIHANPLQAQTNKLAVTITRPGEGELLYTGQGAPHVCVPVTGWITADQIDVTQVQVKLELYQDSHRVGSLTTSPAKDGKYWFDVAVNDNNPDDHPVTECAGGMCHVFSTLGFPAGRVLVRVTATDALGRKAIAERSVVVDHSGSANVPVQVVVEGASNTMPQGINLAAATRLYEWRMRQYIASTDANGRTLFNVEALGQASTVYVFRLDPVVVDGIQYSSREYAQLVLPPGATTAEPVTLFVQASRGQINATITSQNSFTLRAIELPSGRAHSAKIIDGKVTLSNLPIGKYLLDVDSTEAASQGLLGQPRMIDLTHNPITSTAVSLLSAKRTVRGIVHDSEGNALPLVWLVADEQGKSIRASPINGEFAPSAFIADTNSLWVIAPGYFRRAIALDSDNLDIELTREPETRMLSWGTGVITLPPESLATVTGNRISLRRGWLWGKGAGSFSITTPDAEIELSGGTFALESLLDAPSWLYMIDGQARVTILEGKTEIAMAAGQMLAFGYGVTRPIPVTLDGTVARALHAGESSPVHIATNPDGLARLQDELARRGISIRLLVFSILGVIVIGARAIVVRRRQRQQKP